MKSLLEFINANTKNQFKTVADFSKKVNDIDMVILAETMYQYMNYQESINNVDINQFKVKVVVK